MRAYKKELFFKIASLTIAIFAALILAEIVLRLARQATLIYYPAGKTFEAVFKPADDYVYELKPGTIFKHYSYYGDFVATYRINSEGLRADRNYGYEKGAGVKRVLIMGDSFAFGRGVENDETCAFVLERLLNRGASRYEVLNCGALGYSTDNEYLFLKKKGLLFGPDVVVLMMFPRNDIMDMGYHDWIADTNGLPEKILDRYYAVDTQNHLVNIQEAKRNLNIPAIKEFLRNNSYVYTFLSEYRYYPEIMWRMFVNKIKGEKKIKRDRSKIEAFDIRQASPEEKEMMARAGLLLDGMRDISEKAGARFMMFLIPDSKYDNYFVSYAQSKGIEVIDIGAYLKKDGIDSKTLLLRRDMHWSKLGNAYIAGLIYRVMTNAAS